MSGGTMIALNSDKIVMGKQSQLGPMDAQLPVPGGLVSASSILNQFNTAKKEIFRRPGDCCRMGADPPDHGAIAAVTSTKRAGSRPADRGRRIGIEECITEGLTVEPLEEDQDFQDEVLTAYHLLTIVFEQSTAVKIVRNHNGQGWVRHYRINQ